MVLRARFGGSVHRGSDVISGNGPARSHNVADGIGVTHADDHDASLSEFLKGNSKERAGMPPELLTQKLAKAAYPERR